MKTRRLGVGVAVLNEFVYAVGGSDGGKPWDSVEKYNPKNDTWQVRDIPSDLGPKSRVFGLWRVSGGAIHAAPVLCSGPRAAKSEMRIRRKSKVARTILNV